MRTRHSLTAAVVAFVVILVGVIISLLTGGGPHAHAEGPGPAPSVAPPPSVARPAPPPGPRTTVQHRHDTNAERRKATTVSAPTASPARSTPAVSAPQPPRLGPAKVPADADYAVSADGRAFTARYSSLESGPDVGRLSRTQTITIPVTGDADDTTLTLALQGYAFAIDDSTATLTVTVNGTTTTRSYHAETDRTFTERVDVPLRGVRSCRITVKVAVDGAEGYLNASVIDGELG